MKTLVTGFEAFDGRSKNQTEELARCFSKKISADCSILPVTFENCFSPIEAWLNTNDSVETLIISLGEAPIRDLQIEHIALNRKHAPDRGDNHGKTFIDAPIQTEAALAQASSFSPEKIIALYDKHGLKIRISYSAGQYVCNALFYQLLQCENKYSVRTSFFHVPVDLTEELKNDILTRLIFFYENLLKGEI